MGAGKAVIFGTYGAFVGGPLGAAAGAALGFVLDGKKNRRSSRDGRRGRSRDRSTSSDGRSRSRSRWTRSLSRAKEAIGLSRAKEAIDGDRRYSNGFIDNDDGAVRGRRRDSSPNLSERRRSRSRLAKSLERLGASFGLARAQEATNVYPRVETRFPPPAHFEGREMGRVLGSVSSSGSGSDRSISPSQSWKRQPASPSKEYGRFESRFPEERGRRDSTMMFYK
jgi:hypothetical protein